MTFTDDYSTVLSPFVVEYKSAKNEKGRKAVLKDAADAVMRSKELLEDGGADLPKDLQTTIYRFMQRSIKDESKEEVNDPKPKKIKQVYSIRDVIKQNHRDLIEDEIPYKSTDKEYIGSYQRAVTTVLNNMDEKELEEAEKVLDLWNKQGAPKEVQCKHAKNKLPNAIKKKVEDWKFSSGAVVMCLVAYSDGDDVQAFHVESSPVLGNAFTQSFDDWRSGTYEYFKEWASKQFNAKDRDSDDDDDVPVQYQKAKDIPFKKNKRGDVVMPPITDYRTVRARQRVIRGYLGAVYREFTGNSIAAFPFLLAAKEDQTIFLPDCVPEGFTLSDPDHLKAHEINSLYHHWLARQKEGLPPLVILNASPNHAPAVGKSEKAKGKQKMKYVDVDSDDAAEEDDGDDEKCDHGKEGEDMVRGEGEEDLPQIKRGPPKRKQTENPPATQTLEPSAQEAGPSTRSPAQPKAKKRKAKDLKKVDFAKTLDTTSVDQVDRVKNVKGKKDMKQAEQPATGKSSKNTRSTKRKAEEELEEAPPQKLSKVDGAKGSRRGSEKGFIDEASKPQRGKKRSTPADLPATPAKRKRVGGVDLNAGKSRNAKTDPVSPLREARVRVKDYPSGNAVTSTSRIAFLKHLCQLPNFLFLVDRVPTLPNASKIPDHYPSWSSWKSRETHLPAKFHTPDAFFNALSIVRNDLEDDSIINGKIDAPLLLLGLMYREVSRAVEVEPGAETGGPRHLLNSPLGIQQLEELQTLINGLEFVT